MEGVSRARPEAARGTERSEYRTGEDVGEAAPLMPLERPKPLVWGAVKEAKRPAACIPDDRGRLAPLAGEGRGGVVRRVKFTPPVESTKLYRIPRQIQRGKSCRPRQRLTGLFLRLALPLPMPLPLKVRLAASAHH